MYKIFVDENEIFGEEIIINRKEELHHINRVLRIKVNEVIEVSDQENFQYTCKVKKIDIGEMVLSIEEKTLIKGESEIKYHLFQGMPKHGKIDEIVQKSVELGVATVTPVYMKRSVVQPSDKDNKRSERLNAIALSAAKQAKRGKVPSVNKPILFRELINEINKMDLIVLPYEEEKDKNIKSLLNKNNENMTNIAVIIGPEGGFDSEEIKMLMNSGIEPVSLGERILRTETASSYVLSVLQYELEL